MEFVLGALVIAALFTLLIAFGYEGERTWPGLGLFFLILFLPIWALALWIPAVGPLWYGVAWLDYIAFALILTFFILAISPNKYRNRHFERDMTSMSSSDRNYGNEATLRSYSFAFWAFVVFMILAILMGSAAAQEEKADGERPVVVISTFDTAQGTGCWATLYDRPGYEGREITLYDGVDLPEMEVGETDWTGKVKSIITGPKARLILYGEEFWSDRDYTVLPSTRVRSMKTLPWNEVESLKLQCVP